MPRAAALIASATVIGVAVSGCQFTGAGGLPLPFRAGTSDGSYQVTVEMASADNLVPNSEVKVNDLTVGTVTAIQFHNWQAQLIVGLNPGTLLPANATARVGQKSLLGATYLEMAAPTDGTAIGRLRNGDVIPVARTRGYPSTEELLASLSVVLNGGGLNQIKTITTELNHALDGHETDVRALIDNLQSTIGTLNDQRSEIVRAIDGLNRFSAQLAAQRDTIATALDQIPPGLAVLNRNRDDLTSTLTAVAELSTVANRVIDGSRADLQANLQDLQPTLGRLADAGMDLTQSLSLLPTFPFPMNTAGNSVRGDYMNLFLTLDVTLPALQQGFLTGTPLQGVPPLGQSGTTDPLRAPLVENLPGLAPAVTSDQAQAAPDSSVPSNTGQTTPTATAPPSPESGRSPLGGLLSPLGGAN